MKHTYFGRCLLLTAVILVCARPVHATSIGLTFTGMDSWTATWADALGPILSYTAGSPNRLAETLSFSNLVPVEITFTENSIAPSPEAPTFSNTFGLRFTMSQNITNSTGFAWSGFTESLIEGNPNLVAPFADPTFHPSFAHFHDDVVGFTASPFSIGGGFSKPELQFGGGTLGNGDIWHPTGIGIHEWQVGGNQRSFTLRQTPIAAPVPEPSTLMLCLGGCLPFAWRKCREHVRNWQRR